MAGEVFTSSAGPKKSVKDIDILTAGLSSAFTIDDVVGKTLTENLATRYSVSADRTAKAQTVFHQFSLSRVSQDVRNLPTYFAPGDDLVASQQTVIQNKAAIFTNSKINHSIQLTLSDDDIAKYGLTKTGGDITGNIQVDDVISHIESKSVGTEFYASTFSSSPAFNACAAQIEAERRIKEITNPGNGGTTTAGGSGNTGTTTGVADEDDNPNASIDTDVLDLTADNLVKEKVDLQMDDVTSAETQLKFKVPSRADQSDITNTVQNFEITGGPADITSYHDFYRLNIAFEHIWTELFDYRLGWLGQQLYEEYARLKDFNGIQEADPTISSVDELRKMMDEIRSRGQQLAANDPRFQVVATTYPQITLPKWGTMDGPLQNVLYSTASVVNGIFGLNPTGIGRIPGVGVTVGPPPGTRKNPDGSVTVGPPPPGFRKNPDGSVTVGPPPPGLGRLPVPTSRLEQLLNDLDKLLTGKYSFDVFAANSINFGVLATYRQEWEPVNYQVGDLVSTIPLAPQEIRRYTTRVVEKKSRSTREIDDALEIRKKESSDTSRVDSEIVEKALDKTNFKQTAEGGVNMEVYNIKASESHEQDQVKESAQTKREFHESVLKTAEEYKHEHRLEVDTTSSQETETTTFHEIRNPNDEIPVTYLFYELQRTYNISEKLHKLTPVILVANDVPAPHDINESWLITHDWILKRVILDDTFLPALDYLSKSFVGSEIALEVLRTNMEKQAETVQQIGQQVSSKNQALATAQAALDTAIQNYKDAQSSAHDQSIVSKIFDPLNIFGGSDKPDYDALRLSISSAKDALDRAQTQANQLLSQLETEMTALQVATDKYSAAVEEHFNHQTDTDRLRIHIKDNILYYMQAIWNHEPPDQRFFRLYNIDVPVIKGATSGIAVPVKTEAPSLIDFPVNNGAGKNKLILTLPFPQITIEKGKLVEIADLDTLLGYKGNYMIFPLKDNNYLTHYMMQDYIDVDEIVGVHDPDEFGNYTLDEIEEFMKCVYKTNPGLFERYKEEFQQIIIDRLSSPRHEKDLVIVPTTSLYIEALPGKHPLLEDFKLIHRAIDVKKVQAEVRHAELENVRLASRALKGEDSDPDVEKKIVIEDGKGTSSIVVNPEGS